MDKFAHPPLIVKRVRVALIHLRELVDITVECGGGNCGQPIAHNRKNMINAFPERSKA